MTAGSSLVFNSSTWSNNQPVTLAASQDFGSDSGQSVIQCSSPGLFSVNVIATEADDEPILTIQTSTNTVSVPEGSTNTFQIRLDAAPNAAVTVQVSRISGDTDIVISSGTTRVFNAGNYSTWQPVTLSAAEDTDFSEDTASLQCSIYSGTTTVTATEQENDLGQTLPFEETFETNFPMAGTIGTVDGQHGWSTDGSGAIVQTGTVYSGDQALQLQSVSLSHLFTDAQTNPVITLYAQLQVTEEQPDTNDLANSSVVFWVNTNTYAEAYNGSSITTNTSVQISTGTWHQLEFLLDYPAKTWSLDLNGTNLFSSAGFYDTNQSSFSELLITENSPTAHSYLDEIHIARQQQGAADSDGDNLPDEWETQHYGGATNANPDAFCANGVNTVLEAYIAGLNPTNPSSKFLLTDLQLGISNGISWQPVSGRIYTVYWSSNLLSTFDLIGSNLSWPASSFTDTQHQNHADGFYKLKVELAP